MQNDQEQPEQWKPSEALCLYCLQGMEENNKKKTKETGKGSRQDSQKQSCFAVFLSESTFPEE